MRCASSPSNKKDMDFIKAVGGGDVDAAESRVEIPVPVQVPVGEGIKVLPVLFDNAMYLGLEWDEGEGAS